MKKIPVSLQLWSLRDAVKFDFAATVAAVAQIGYAGVETAGFGNLDAARAKTALDAAGLRVSGMHVGRDALRSDVEKCAAEARLLGTHHVICPHWPREEFTTGATCARLGEELGAIGAKLRAHGLRFSFHNHAAEFALVDGHRVLDWMLDAAAPRDLGCELDVYWAHVAGKNPADFIREQGRRVELLHLKDETVLGRGPVDFAAVLAAVDAVGAAEWLVVEQESYTEPPLESVRLCFAQLKAWGRA